MLVSNFIALENVEKVQGWASRRSILCPRQVRATSTFPLAEVRGQKGVLVFRSLIANAQRHQHRDATLYSATKP
jgi:hypothetical protein